MHIEEDSIDDILNRVYTSLLSDAKTVRTSKGQTAELIGTLLRLRNPRARLSNSETRLKLFSALGEFVWYVAGSDEPQFIAHYIPWYKNVKLDDGRVPGAYGPRLFGSAPNDQFRKVIEVLKERRTSRRAVAQLYRAEDLALSIGADSTSELLEVPCTCTLQFLIREETLQLVVHMRSNDAYKGLPHDVFCFTMLQELVARALGIEPGIYVHSVGSLHLYEEDWQRDRAPSCYQVIAEVVAEFEGELLRSIRSVDQWTAKGSKCYVRLHLALAGFPYEVSARRAGLDVSVQL